jgi:hypothetical protein
MNVASPDHYILGNTYIRFLKKNIAINRHTHPALPHKYLLSDDLLCTWSFCSPAWLLAVLNK